MVVKSVQPVENCMVIVHVNQLLFFLSRINSIPHVDRTRGVRVMMCCYVPRRYVMNVVCVAGMEKTREAIAEYASSPNDKITAQVRVWRKT